MIGSYYNHNNAPSLAPKEDLVMIPSHKAAPEVCEHGQTPVSVLRWGVILWVVAIVTLIQSSLIAQTNPNIDNGIKPFGSYDARSIDHIDLASGGLSLHIPLVSFPQRGSFPPISYSIGFAGKQLTILDHCVTKLGDTTCNPRWTPRTWDDTGTPGLGVYVIGDNGIPGVYAKLVGTQFLGQPNSVPYFQYMAIGSDRSIHRLYGSPFSSDLLAEDGSGFLCRACNITNDWIGGYTAKTRKGITQTSPLGYLTPSSGLVSNIGLMSGEDPHGNLENTTDTMGRTLNAVATSDSSGCQGPLPFANSQIISIPGVNGNNTLIKYCNASLTLLTAFNDGSYATANGSTGVADTVAESSGSENVVQTVLLWDGNGSVSSPIWSTSPIWIFQYNNGQSGSGVVNYGDLTQITLPTGGTIQYVWGTISGLCSDNGTPNMSRAVVSRTENANDGSPAVVTTYNRSQNPSFTTTSNDGMNDTVHTFTAIGGTCSLYETQTKYYSGTASSRTLLKTIGTDYTYTTIPDMYWFFLSNVSVYPRQVMGVLPIRTTTTLPNGFVSKVEKDYQTATAYYNVGQFSGQYPLSTGSVIQQREYDWGSGSPGGLIRCTATTYKDQVNSAYFSANLLDIPASVSVYSGACGSGTLASNTTYGYDESTPINSGITTQRDPNASSLSVRGNLTSKHRWLSTTGTTLDETYAYYDTGERYSYADPLGQTTYYSYSSDYAGSYLTKTQLPKTGSVSHVVQAGYDFNTGLMTSFTDQNSQISTYSYDLLGRIATANFPDTGLTSFAYPSYSTVQKSARISPSVTHTVETDFDGLGRLSQTQLSSDPEGAVYSTTTYNAQGQTYQVSNPYRSTSDSSYGLTTFGYDGLGRRTMQTNPDRAGSRQTWTYSGNAVIFTDEAGNQWQRSTDALGRLTQVLEPNGSSQSPTMETDYSYNALNNLLSATQCGGSCTTASVNGTIVRSFSYDSLSRLVCASNPENSTSPCPLTAPSSYVAGTIGYSYYANGNVLSKTDARGTVTSYSYDSLNRLLGKSYSDNSTPSSCYLYDLSTVPNGVGRLAAEWTQPGTCPGTQPAVYITMRSFLGYDAMGRVTSEQQCLPNSGGTGSCTTSPSAAIGQTYNYDLAGNLTSYSNGVNNVPGAGTIAFGLQYDGAGRLQNLSSSWNPATNSSSGPTPLFTADPSAGYSAAGAIQNVILGNNIFVNKTYDSRLRVTGETATHP